MGSTALIIVLILFIFLTLNMGINRSISTLPFLFVLFLVILFVGYFFFPILFILLIWYLINKNRPRPNRRTYYYKWDNSGAQDFEEFFRRASGNYSGGYQQGGGYYNGTNNNPFGYTEDLTKYYEILGVSKGATKDEIKKAYRDLVKQHHPDKFANNPREKEYHENKLKEINEAYEKLVKE